MIFSAWIAKLETPELVFHSREFAALQNLASGPKADTRPHGRRGSFRGYSGYDWVKS